MIDLAYSEFGETQPGVPLLIVHGLFGSRTNWRSIARHLGERFHVLTVDLRNHGDSPHTKAMDYPAMASDLAQFIDQRCGGKAHVLGHSMGGKAAMVLALTEPERVAQLLVVDIAPVSYPQDHQWLIDAMQQLDLTALTSRQAADQALMQRIGDPAVRQFLLQNLARQGKGYVWRLNLPVLEAAQADIAAFPELHARFDGPACFLYGDRSDYVLPTHHAAIYRYFPQAELMEIPAAGHWVHAEQPAVLLRAVTSFLDTGHCTQQ